MITPDLESMITEVEENLEFQGYVGFNGDLVEVDEEGNHIIVGSVDIGGVHFLGFNSHSFVHGLDNPRP